ncbi:uncharacterized protein V3H82_007403 [Fundulus diaphanus]
MPYLPTGVAALALLLGSVRLGRPCQKVDLVLFCTDALTNFSPGCTTLFVGLKNVGEINSTVLQSEHLSSIRRFVSKDSGITGVAENAFSSLSSLENVTLDGNGLSSVNQNWFGNPATVRELGLSSNRIEALNESDLKGLANLWKLKLNGNRIQTVHPGSFSSQDQLAVLDLSENRLTRLPRQVFTSLKSLTSIGLYGNPWNCSCDAQDFVDSLRELSSSLLADLANVTCETPEHLRGRPLLNLSVCPTTPAPGTPLRNRSTPTTKTPATRQSAKTETSLQSKPTDPPGPTPHEGPPTTSNPNVCTLIAVIAVLCVLLLVVSFMAAMRRRNRSSKAVRPGCPTEGEKKHEEDGMPSPDRSAGRSGHPEEPRRKSFTGIRAKSANAIILSSPFYATEKDKVTSPAEVEAPLEKSGNKNLGSESGAERGGAARPETVATFDPVEERVTQDGDAGQLSENQECAHVNTGVIPYLSIGSAQNKPGPDKDSSEGPGWSPQSGKFIQRISTWPPTAPQWQARCKRREEEGEDVGVFAVWTQSGTVELSEDVKIMMEHPSSTDQSEKQEGRNPNLSPPDGFKPPEAPVAASEVEGLTLSAGSVTQAGTRVREDLETEEHPSQKNSSDVRKDQKRSVTVRQRADDRAAAAAAAAGSKASSGGASPDDETLLSGNEYAFMDLLHEVVQNNGRWTRERWKQIHVNKQRR